MTMMEPPRHPDYEPGLHKFSCRLFLSTSAYFDVALRHLKIRMEDTRQDTEFCAYFFNTYVLEHNGKYSAPWYCGLGGPPKEGHSPSQQPAEQFNRKLKHDLAKSGQNLGTHSGVVSALQQVLKMWSAEPLAGERSKKPVTLMAAKGDVSTLSPLRPQAWMLKKKGQRLRRPGGRMFLFSPPSRSFCCSQEDIRHRAEIQGNTRGWLSCARHLVHGNREARACAPGKLHAAMLFFSSIFSLKARRTFFVFQI